MIKVFVSSTRKDMDQDCRPVVLDAFKLVMQTVESLALNMEDWSTEYRPAVEVCRDNVGRSTHYLGIFGFYRGWVPPGEDASITELEFEWARGKRIAVFLPHATQPQQRSFARELEERAAAHQNADALAAQKRFIERVANEGTVEHFDSAAQLGMRTLRRLYLWAEPLIDAAPAAATSPRSRRPRADDLTNLGFADQVSLTESTLQRIALPGVRAAACLLIHGQPAFGHEQLITRLYRIIERDAFQPPRRCNVGCGPLWRQRGLTSMLAAIGKEIEAGWEPSSLAELAGRLEKLLAVSDVVLVITKLQHYEGGVPGFATSFWQPLLAALPANTRYRLLCLTTHESTTEDATWLPHLHDAAATFDATRLVALPLLKSFTLGELALFVRRYLAPEDATVVADALMTDTGGQPHLLYRALLDDDTWR